ncbi:hypothetical protein SAMN06272735_8891 [Streptomyces sp. TLI_55]|uniref:hypothetical protein n=1 Tax=Streptomyces sp. TLI_55 TaxID=1938861 RepID=UPI000BDA8FCD|nr:hypothetical protein [Streptomyces sp. TLI_55]SNX88442.1 hypothetical protein SAMN06272735_8891 [Streptomyces sp. TLI_55]
MTVAQTYPLTAPGSVRYQYSARIRVKALLAHTKNPAKKTATRTAKTASARQKTVGPKLPGA